MPPVHQPISKRMIAVILLLNHTLMSCYNHTMIEPSREVEKIPAIAINKENKQPKIEAYEAQEVPIVPPTAMVVRGDFDEETILSVQPKPIQLDSARSKLEDRRATKENTPTVLQSKVDNRHQAVAQIQRPIAVSLPSRNQTPFMIIYPSSQSTAIIKDQQQVQSEEKNQRIQPLEPVKQLLVQEQLELHAHILQAMQNPIWKRHFSGNQLPISPMQGHYQLARVQESLQPLAVGMNVRTREGQPVNFIQDMGYWWGIVQENRPGFSRNVVLPVLYPNQTEHTVENLARMPAALQQQLVHIFSQDRSLKNGFVYMGQEMGLVGGTRCNPNVAKAKVLKKAETAAKAMSKEEKEALEQTEKLQKFMATKKPDKPTGEAGSTVREEEKKAKSVTGQAIEDMGLPQAYKKLSQILSSHFPEFETNNLNNINYLQTEFGDKLINNPKYAAYVTPKDKALYDSYVKERQDHGDYLKEKKENLINMAKDQAEADLQNKQTSLDDSAQKKMTQVSNLLYGIAAAEASGDPQNAIKQIKANISEWETFREDVKFFPDIQQKVNVQLGLEQARLAEATRKAELIKWARQGTPHEVEKKTKALQNMVQTPNPATIQDPEKRANAMQEINKQAIDAIAAGWGKVLELAIRDKGFSVQEQCDRLKNTPLHLAVEKNQIESVEMLLNYQADTSSLNRRKETPLDLATKSGVNSKIKQLLAVNK